MSQTVRSPDPKNTNKPQNHSWVKKKEYMNLRGYRGGIVSTEFRHMKFLKNKNIILKIIILLNC